LDNFKTVVLIHGKLRELNERADSLGRAVDQVDQRLVRVETVLEFATEGRFRPRLIPPGREPGER
jgi:hypothetical protein